MYQELPMRPRRFARSRSESSGAKDASHVRTGLVCHLVAALEEHLGDVAEAQLVAQPPEHREHHDVGREPDLV